VATVALRRPAALERSIAGVPVAEIAGLTALVALSLVLRTSQLHVHFWIDEGLSVGIGSHPLSEIPGVLRQDGSPPLYYALLHVWMDIFGRSEAQTHIFSLVCALLTIPAAWWAGTSLFDKRTGWALAGLTAINPFLTSYAQETRMYALVILLGTLCTACFLHAYVFGRRAYRIPFGILLAALLYTHNWAFFYGLALVLVLVAVARVTPDRRPLWRDVAVGFGLAALLYLPWVPTLVFQTLHTGAPWATPPSVSTLVKSPNLLLGGQSGTFVVILAATGGLAALAARSRRDREVLVPAMAALATVPIASAWLLSQASPAWATRYLAIALPPLLLLAAVGLTRSGKIGVGALALLVASWIYASGPDTKSNAHFLAESMTPHLRAGDVVLSTQPEQIPTLAYYLSPRLTYANPFGVVHDTGVADWRDGAQHFDRTGVDTQLLPMIKRMRIGQRLLLVVPIVFKPERWRGPWTQRVRDRSMEYEGVLRADSRLKLDAIVPENFRLPGPNPLQGLLFIKKNNGQPEITSRT
jgi:mannosyltransferase